ncbi:MAG: hypothetical protein Q8P90_00805 [bacterium]|nr:hypothetical protein [bacterium]
MNFENSSKKIPQSSIESTKYGLSESKLDPELLAETRQDLRDLFRSSKSPIQVLLEQFDTKKFQEKRKPILGDEALALIRQKLETVSTEDEDEFVEQAIQAYMPILQIKQHERAHEPETQERNMFTPEDLNAIVEYIRQSDVQKIIVVGNIGSGKSTMSRKLSSELGYKNIDLDLYFQIYRQEHDGQEATLPILVDFILKREEPPYIINHADLLRQNLAISGADMVILLSPPIDEQLRSRLKREEEGAEGEWHNVSPEDYETINKEDLASFSALEGDVSYSNDSSGTMVKHLSREA